MTDQPYHHAPHHTPDRTPDLDQPPRATGPQTRPYLELVVSADPATVQGWAPSAFRALSAKISAVEPHRVEARTGANWKSWGQLLTVEPAGAEHSTRVAVRSRPRLPTQLVDLGAARDAVEAIARRLWLLERGETRRADHAPPPGQPG